jgi:hypothetical protein
MTRDRIKTVTRKEVFALLIPSSEGNANGEATFAVEWVEPLFVRAVTLEELKEARRKIKGMDGEFFLWLLTLRGALDAKDDLLLARAEERLEKIYRKREHAEASRRSPKLDEQRQKLRGSIAPAMGMSSADWQKHWEGLRPGPKAKLNLHRRLSYEVSQRLLLAQLALWWTKGDLRPAIYCMDVETALYVHTFLIAPTGSIGFRVCPYCADQFFQDRPNQDYCRPAHREAHRVARWRYQKKTDKANQERKNNVTYKAR